MSTTASPYRLTFLQALRLQLNVIGALIMRETETRYGHQKLGIIWLFGEPLLLGMAIAFVKLYSGIQLPAGVPVMLYGVICYLPFYMFRALVGRSTGALQANVTLLFHRNVTLLDIMIARSLLEFVGILGVVAFIELVAGFSIGSWPAQPMTLAFALVIMALIGHGLGMIIASITAASEGVDRVIHMMTYLTMPISGSMFMLASIPEPYRSALLWVPLVNVHEMARDGQFGNVIVSYYDIPYMLYWAIGLNLLGMIAMRVVRPKLSVF